MRAEVDGLAAERAAMVDEGLILLDGHYVCCLEWMVGLVIWYVMTTRLGIDLVAKTNLAKDLETDGLGWKSRVERVVVVRGVFFLWLEAMRRICVCCSNVTLGLLSLCKEYDI